MPDNIIGHFRLLTKSILFLNTSLKSNDSRAEKDFCELLSAQGRALSEQKIFRQVALSHALAKIDALDLTAFLHNARMLLKVEKYTAVTKNMVCQRSRMPDNMIGHFCLERKMINPFQPVQWFHLDNSPILLMSG